MVANARIKVIGVGGGGGNAVQRMQRDHIKGVSLHIANTDEQALRQSMIQDGIRLGVTAKGLGAGGNPKIGEMAALESITEIESVLEDTDLLFIAVGMGGGTGTGAAPVIAKKAKEKGILTIGITTRPFGFEGRTRAQNAEDGINKLVESVDSLIIIPNDRILKLAPKLAIEDAFSSIDDILRQGVQTVTDLLTGTSLINLDFADVKATLSNKGAAMFGIGMASGKNKANEAAINAVKSPLLEFSIRGCTDAIVNITGGINTTLQEVDDAISAINEYAGKEMNIIFGYAVNEKLEDEVIVTVIATGYNRQKPEKDEPVEKVVSFASTDKYRKSQYSSSPEVLASRNDYGSHTDDIDLIFGGVRGGVFNNR